MRRLDSDLGRERFDAGRQREENRTTGMSGMYFPFMNASMHIFYVFCLTFMIQAKPDTQMCWLLNIIVIAGLITPLISAGPAPPCTVTSVQHSTSEFGKCSLGDVISTLVAASSPDPLAIHWDTLPNVTCMCSPSTTTSVTLLGGYTGLTQSTASSSSLLSLARAQEQEVLSLCPSSAYARWRSGEVLDVSQELVALQMRQHPHHHGSGGSSHGDVCDGVLHPSSSPMAKPSRPSRFLSLVFGIPMDIVRWLGSWVVPSASWHESVALTVLHVLHTTTAVVTDTLRGEYVPSVVRGLSMEDVTVRVTNVTLLESVFLEQGARAMLQHVQKNVRVHTFPPSTPPSSSHLQQEVNAAALRCDLNAMLLLEATHRTLQDEINSAGASSSLSSTKTTFDGSSLWMLLYPSAFPPLTGGVRKPSLLTPLCQFRLAGGSQSTATDVSSLEGAVSHHAGLEAWWRLFQQRDASASVLSHVNLDIHEGPDDASPVTLSSPPVVTFDAICRIERRYLDDPVCLGVQGAAGLVNSNITITSTLRFDLLWWYLFLAMVAATVLSPLFSKYSTLQVALCFVLGVVVMLCVAIFFVAKDLHRTRIGKAGILAVIASGGVMLAVEGLATALVSLIAHELQTNSAVHAFVALAGVVSAVLSRYLFGAFLREITRAVFATVQLSLLVFMYLVNGDATIVTVVGVAALKLQLLQMAITIVRRFVWWFCVCPVVAFVALLLGGGVDSDNDASDRVPVLDPNHEAAYHRPLAASSTSARAGRNATERFAAYEKEGSEYTRKALEELAATVRAQPGKYASRVRDPNGLARFAGANE